MDRPLSTSAPIDSFRPLTGLKVLDFTSTLAGPYATMILAQLGADVVKIEPPNGDDSRHWPPQIADGSVTYRQMNAGKRSLCLDLAREEAATIALHLAAEADVLVQNMRPGVAERLGIGEAAIRAVNPDILYYSLNGFGVAADGAALPGYDPLVQAVTGIMLMNGHDGTPPTRCAPSVIDLGSGQWIAMAILAAVLARHRGYAVRSVETALVDTAFSLVPHQAVTALLSGRRPARAGSGNPMVAPNQSYPTRDGDIMIVAPNQRLWERVVGVIDAPELLSDERFRTVPARSANSAALEQAVTARLADADATEWVRRFRAAGVPVACVAGLEEAVRSDMAAQRNTFAELDGTPMVRLPWMVDGDPVPWARPAPALGEHTIGILQAIGYDDETIGSLRQSGSVWTSDDTSGAARRSPQRAR